jgi:hypothetical protein
VGDFDDVPDPEDDGVDVRAFASHAPLGAAAGLEPSLQASSRCAQERLTR